MVWGDAHEDAVEDEGSHATAAGMANTAHGK